MLNKLYSLKARLQFKQNTVLSDENDITFLSKAKCRNSGDKSNICIGKHCTLGCSMLALCGGKIVIGNNVYIGPNTIIESKESVNIGNDVIIANDVVICDNNNHPVSPEDRLKMSQCNDYLRDPLWNWEKAISSKIVIAQNVWIGRDARILKGVTIGEGAIVALGAIVTHDVPPYSVVAGNPARVVKELKKGK